MLDRDYADRILDATPVHYFQSSTHDGARITWPWRMFPPGEARESYVNASDVFAMDSEPQDPSVSNRDVLDIAHELGADIALLVDYFPFDAYDKILYDSQGDPKNGKEDAAEAFESIRDAYPDAGTASIDSVKEGLALAEDHPFDGDIWVPLQEPWVENWRRLGEPKRVAIGGLKDEPSTRKVEVARDLRDATGPDVWIHGLGYGPSPKVVDAVRRDPDLLDSVDSRTAGTSSLHSQDLWHGDEVCTPLAAHVLGFLLEGCRRFAGFGENPDGELTTLDRFG